MRRFALMYRNYVYTIVFTLFGWFGNGFGSAADAINKCFYAILTNSSGTQFWIRSVREINEMNIMNYKILKISCCGTLNSQLVHILALGLR